MSHAFIGAPMSKSRRLHALNRKMESLCCRTGELIAKRESYHLAEKSLLDIEREHTLAEKLKSIFTPEYQQAMQEYHRLYDPGRPTSEISYGSS